MSAPPDEDDDEDTDAAHTMMGIYYKCVVSFGWSLKDIDDTDFETLVEFIAYKLNPKAQSNKNHVNIGEKTYKRIYDVPEWL